MKATETKFVDLLKGPKQFLIPIYQRTYSWTEAQCRQLWEDVVRIAADDRFEAHFIGSVVYIERGLYQTTSLPALLVIDGQQRLTTLTLLIEALARSLEESGAEAGGLLPKKLRNYFLFNAEESGDERFKLKLSKSDAPVLQALLEKTPEPEGGSGRIRENFGLFQAWIAETELDVEALYRGLHKLVVVDIALDRNHDNPQLIFESLNSTGLDLSQADLVRNFVLMGLEPDEQNRLYETYWVAMEERFEEIGNGAFDDFLRAWLTIRLERVPNRRKGYAEFRAYRAAHPEESIEELVEDLSRMAGYYAAISFGTETDPDLARVFDDLAELRSEVSVPFLMVCYDDWKGGRLAKDELLAIARLIESWLFRRWVCDIPSNVLSRTFAALPAQLKSDAWLESLRAALLIREGRQRFPGDEEFRAAFATRNLYETPFRKYWLDRLENAGRKERVAIGAFTVEHVLPQSQKLPPEWREMLGERWREVQERWLHTAGNLTLTGYNPELSNRSFETKRDMQGGFKDSPIRLNRDLARAERWTEEEIVARGRRLAEKAAEVWRAPELPEEVLATYREAWQQRKSAQLSYDLEHFAALQGEMGGFYERIRERLEERGLEECVRKVIIGFALPDFRSPWPYVLRFRPYRTYLDVRLYLDRRTIPNPPEWTREYVHRNGSRRTVLSLRPSVPEEEFLALVDRAIETVRALK